MPASTSPKANCAAAIFLKSVTSNSSPLLQDALHAHALLHRDVDYVVKDGAVEMVDEFRGRVALDRRWPAGLHTAIEIKEGVATKQQGHILGSITMQHVVALYSHVCGMTGTAASSAGELQTVYLLPVEVIPTNRPMIRVDHRRSTFSYQSAKVPRDSERNPCRSFARTTGVGWNG